MKKFAFIMACIFTWSITCVTGGYIVGKKLTKPIIITEHETIWKDKIIYKNIAVMSPEEKDKDLECFYRNEFKLTLKPLPENNMYRISGKLCDREATKDFEVQCGESGNWKLYGGIAAAGIIGTAIYIKTR